MNKILVSEGIIHELELPEEPKPCTCTFEKAIRVNCKVFCESVLTRQTYEVYKASAIAEAKKNGKFDEEDQEMIKILMHSDAFEKEGVKVLMDKPIDGIYDLPEGLETERVKKCQHKGIHNSTCIYHFVVRITKQKQ